MKELFSTLKYLAATVALVAMVWALWSSRGDPPPGPAFLPVGLDHEGDDIRGYRRVGD